MQLPAQVDIIRPQDSAPLVSRTLLLPKVPLYLVRGHVQMEAEHVEGPQPHP